MGGEYRVVTSDRGVEDLTARTDCVVAEADHRTIVRPKQEIICNSGADFAEFFNRLRERWVWRACTARATGLFCAGRGEVGFGYGIYQ